MPQSVEIKIKMFVVGDADAIIVHLSRNEIEHFVALIDGGEPSESTKIIDALAEVLEFTGKQGPDLVVCTHYDSDHIGGLLQVAAKYGKTIGEFWIHDHEPIKQVAALVYSILDVRGKFSNQKNTVLSSAEHATLKEFSEVPGPVL